MYVTSFYCYACVFVAEIIWTQEKIDCDFSYSVRINVSSFLCDGQHASFLFSL